MRDSARGMALKNSQETSNSRRPSKNNDISSKSASRDRTSRKTNKGRHICFADDENIVSDVFSADEAWRIDVFISNEEIIDRYVAACCTVCRSPLSSVIEQLSKFPGTLTFSRLPAIILKGIQLNSRDIEALEQVFKFCQTYHLSFENCNLNDKSVSMLLDAIDFYAPCIELCLARNSRITSDGFKHLGMFLSKYPCLTWLDLRGIVILHADAQSLNNGLRYQFNTARSALKKYLDRRAASDTSLPPADGMLSQGRRRIPDHLLRLYIPNYASNEERKEKTDALCELPPMCLRGLHLGETGISGPSLGELAIGIRVSAHLSDLRLPSNKLTASDMEQLIPLLRYYPGLRVLDLSNNDLGDAGCKILGSALSKPAFPSHTLPPEDEFKVRGCLRRLYLSDNGIRAQGAAFLAPGLAVCRRLTHLELDGNLHMGSISDLAPALRVLRRLKYIGLARCGLTCQGAITLAELLADGPRLLQRLDLTGNFISEAGLLALSRSLPFASNLIHLQGLEENGPKPQAIPSSSLISRIPLLRATKNPQPSAHNITPTPENSQLSLELLAMIHAQLAANLDARQPSGSSSKKKSSSVSSRLCPAGVRMFRGYIRFPGDNNSTDSRHLIGDTGSEEDSDVDILETPKKAKEGNTNIYKKKEFFQKASIPKRKRTVSESLFLEVPKEASKLRHKRTSSLDLLDSGKVKSYFSSFSITETANGDADAKDLTRQRSTSPDVLTSKSKQYALKSISKTKYPDKSVRLQYGSDDEDPVPLNDKSSPKKKEPSNSEIKSSRKERLRSSSRDSILSDDEVATSIVKNGSNVSPTSKSKGSSKGGGEEDKPPNQGSRRSNSREGLIDESESTSSKLRTSFNNESSQKAKGSDNVIAKKEVQSSKSRIQNASKTDDKSSFPKTRSRIRSNSLFEILPTKPSRNRSSNSVSEVNKQLVDSSKSGKLKSNSRDAPLSSSITSNDGQGSRGNALTKKTVYDSSLFPIIF